MRSLRFILPLALLVVFIVAGLEYVDRGAPDNANAGTTWQAEQFDSWAGFWIFLNGLPSDCAVDWEASPDFLRYAVAYSCPD